MEYLLDVYDCLDVRVCSSDHDVWWKLDKDAHYENTPIQIYRKFHLQKPENFQIKTLINFIFILKT